MKLGGCTSSLSLCAFLFVLSPGVPGGGADQRDGGGQAPTEGRDAEDPQPDDSQGE